MTVVFLSPGDSGETVLSGQNNISKIPSNNRDHISHHQMCKYKNQGFNQPSNFLSLFLPLSLYAPLPSFLSFVLPSYLLSYPHSSILSTFYKVFCSSLLHIFTSSIHTPPFYLPYFLRTHHTPTHRRPVDSLEHRCTLATCSHRCGCHTRSCLDKEVSI